MTYLQSSIETNYLGRVMSTLLTLNTSIMPIIPLYLLLSISKGHINGGLIFIFEVFLPDLYRDTKLPRIYRIPKEHLLIT